MFVFGAEYTHEYNAVYTIVPDRIKEVYHTAGSEPLHATRETGIRMINSFPHNKQN
jgi:hypothetical protein